MIDTDTDTPLGYASACHVAALGRAAFFRSPTDDLPSAESAQVASDDLLPQFGFVGSHYAKRRVLLLGINPGNGPVPRVERSAGDRLALPALVSFVQAPAPETFLLAQRACQAVCQGQASWGPECAELLELTGLTSKDVAFTHVLPWRTHTPSTFSKFTARYTAEHYLRPVLEELQPAIVVAVGRKAAEVLELAGLMTSEVVVWHREQALREAVVRDRAAALLKLKAMLAAQAAPDPSTDD